MLLDHALLLLLRMEHAVRQLRLSARRLHGARPLPPHTSIPEPDQYHDFRMSAFDFIGYFQVCCVAPGDYPGVFRRSSCMSPSARR